MRIFLYNLFQCFFQAKHRDNTAEKLKTMHMEIVRVMKKTFEIFKSDGQEVSFPNKIPNMLQIKTW